MKKFEKRTKLLKMDKIIENAQNYEKWTKF